jgi:hypothetical protein
MSDVLECYLMGSVGVVREAGTLADGEVNSRMNVSFRVSNLTNQW